MPRGTSETEAFGESLTDGVYFDLTAPQNEERFFEFEANTSESGNRFIDMVQHDTGRTVQTWWRDGWEEYAELADYVEVRDKALDDPASYLNEFIEQAIHGDTTNMSLTEQVAVEYAREHTTVEATNE